MQKDREIPYNEQFRNLLKFSMRKSHQTETFCVLTREFFQNGTCFKVLPYTIFQNHYSRKSIFKIIRV